MLVHPDMGFVADGVDFLNPASYAECRKPFGLAASMPRAAYISDIFQNLENEKIWTRGWVCIGTAAEIANTGDLLPYTVGDQGIHVQRLESGDVAGRFNKAQHGGCRVIPAQCRTGKKTKCSFTSCGHSRDRDVILGAGLEEMSPLMGQYLGMRPERLVPLKTKVLGPFIFVNVDPTIGEEHSLPELEWHPSWVRQSGRWREHRANWKIAGKAIVEAARNLIERKKISGAEAKWHFPNLVTVQFSGLAVAVVLQPTSMGHALWRLSYFAVSDGAAKPLFAEIDEILNDAASRAEAEQREIAAPQTNSAELSEVNWEFNQILVERLIQKHVSYWNAPLTSTRTGLSV